jgi:hypothetical protein
MAKFIVIKCIPGGDPTKRLTNVIAVSSIVSFQEVSCAPGNEACLVDGTMIFVGGGMFSSSLISESSVQAVLDALASPDDVAFVKERALAPAPQ